MMMTRAARVGFRGIIHVPPWVIRMEQLFLSVGFSCGLSPSFGQRDLVPSGSSCSIMMFEVANILMKEVSYGCVCLRKKYIMTMDTSKSNVKISITRDCSETRLKLIYVNWHGRVVD